MRGGRLAGPGGSSEITGEVFAGPGRRFAGTGGSTEVAGEPPAGDDTTTVIVNNLSPNPVTYEITSGTPGQDPIVGSLPGHSYGIIEHEFSQKIGVTIGDQESPSDPTGWSLSCRRA